MTALLLTGAPGCGKTTLIRSVLARLQQPAGGFYTQEVRQDGVRVGFEVVMLDGSRGRLAQVGLPSRQFNLDARPRAGISRAGDQTHRSRKIIESVK